MLSSTARRSSHLANFCIDDGDDLHITPSFEASEDNSSTIGNSSCMEPRTAISALSPTKQSEDDSAESEQSSYIPAQLGSSKNWDDQDSRKNLIKKISLGGSLRKAQKLLPWRLNKFLPRTRQSRAIQEYHAMLETEHASPAASDAASYAKSFHSVRSSRVNLIDGRSMLVRQNAQVVGRPSAAQQEWDVGSFAPSDSGSMRSPRSLTWDDGSLSCRSDISRLTGDSFNTRSKRSDFSVSRTMYTNPRDFLLETAFEEDDDECMVEQDENETPNSIFITENGIADFALAKTSSSLSSICSKPVDGILGRLHAESPGVKHDAKLVSNRLLQQKANDFAQISALDLFEGYSDTATQELYTETNDQVRARVYSDSDVVFEMHRQRALPDGCIDEFGFKTVPPFTADQAEQSSGHSDPEEVGVRSFSESCSSLDAGSSEFIVSTPVRPRCASDTYTDAHWRQPNPRPRFLSDPKMTLVRDTVLHRPSLQSRKERLSLQQNFTQAISLVEKNEEDELSQIDRTYDLPRQRGFSDSEVTGVSVGAVLSPSTLSSWKWRSPKFQRTRKSSESNISIPKEDTALLPVAENIGIVNTLLDTRSPLQPTQRLSSSTDMSAAKMIASALRPPSAVVVPSSNKASHNYYWNDGSDEESRDDIYEEVLWSLSKDSFEFEDML